MQTIGYIRVSTELQDFSSQKFGLLEYANSKGFQIDEFVEETISSRKKLEERGIYKLICEKLNENDILLVPEITRLGRSTFEVMDILKILSERKIETHILKNNILINAGENELVTQMQVFMFGLAGQIERDFISLRTKEALAKRKAQGIKLGRKKGQRVKSKLDIHVSQIRSLLEKGINITAIAKLIGCGRTTLSHYVETRNLKPKISQKSKKSAGEI